MAYIQSLSLHHFRSYTQARLDGLGAGFVVLTGPNGAGKTNVLEAVSLLSPGRGMRSADMADWQQRDSLNPWAVSAAVSTDYGVMPLGTGRDPAKDKRVVRVNGVLAKSQTVLSEYLSCIWLTPQMDRLFLEGAAGRRRFFDRMLFVFDPSHAGRITRYENAVAQRSKLLQAGRADPAWLQSLEQQIAETGVAIAAARVDFLNLLQVFCDTHGNQYLPAARLSLQGVLEEGLQQESALALETRFRDDLLQYRVHDAQYGGSKIGPHKTDLCVVYREKNMPADQCSTGEQKALLFGLVLAHAHMMKSERGAPPILLLDEIVAHLDSDRRVSLFQSLHALGAQVWVTGTDYPVFAEALEPVAAAHYFYRVQEGQIVSQ